MNVELSDSDQGGLVSTEAKKRKRNYERFLGLCGAQVASFYTTKGNLSFSAHIDLPHGGMGAAHKNWIMHTNFKSKRVNSVEEGWEWIRKTTLAWGERYGVEFT